MNWQQQQQDIIEHGAQMREMAARLTPEIIRRGRPGKDL